VLFLSLAKKLRWKTRFLFFFFFLFMFSPADLPGNYAGRQAQAHASYFFFLNADLLVLLLFCVASLSLFFSFFWCSPGKAGGQGSRGDWSGGCEGSGGGRSERGY
jgi:hypothetical protein